MKTNEVKNLRLGGEITPCITTSILEEDYLEKYPSTVVLQECGTYINTYITLYDYIINYLVESGVINGNLEHPIKSISLDGDFIKIVFHLTNINVLSTVAEFFGIRGDDPCLSANDRHIIMIVDLEEP